MAKRPLRPDVGSGILHMSSRTRSPLQKTLLATPGSAGENASSTWLRPGWTSDRGIPFMIDVHALELLDREDLLKMLTSLAEGGVFINFYGKRAATEIAKKVRPRVTRQGKELPAGPPPPRGGVVFTNCWGNGAATEIAKKVRPRVTRQVKDLHVGPPQEQCKNMLIEGENLQAMVTLYKYRGQVDLILTDPPYNTGGQFRYNDKWDTDPNDPDLGQLVPSDDTSRHTKWMKAMMPRLHMMKAMLKPSGVIAVCIDDNELFHLGMMMDEVVQDRKSGSA